MLPGNSFNFAYTYNTSTGMLETYEYPSGYKLKYLYDSRGNLLGMSNATTDQALWKAYSENQRGQLTEYSQANGVQTFNMFDQYGYLTQTNSVSFLKDIEHPIQNFGYSFDPATGNLLSRTDIERNLSESFAYDNTKERLASYTHAGVSTQLFYHENGNISKKGDVTSSSVGYTYGAKPHAVTGISNPTSAFVQQAQPQDISFTPFNKVALIRNSQAPKHQLAFTYGPDEQRMMSVLYTTDPSAPLMTKYYCENYEKEVSATSVRELHYLQSPSGLFAIMVKQGATETMYYTHNDHLGSLTAISDATGNLVESLSYDPWGRRRNASNWNDFNVSSTLFDRGFTGHEHLPQFGLINMNGRVYDPFLARFLSPDPFVQSPGNPQNYNRYSYALNNPLKYTDPSGYNYKPDDWNSGQGRGGAITINPYIHSGYQGGIGPGSGNFWSDAYQQSWGAHYNWGSGLYFDNHGNVIGWQQALNNTINLYPDLVSTKLTASNGRIAGSPGISKIWDVVTFNASFEKLTKGIGINNFDIHGETGVINKFVGYNINLQLVDYGNNSSRWQDEILSEIANFTDDINEFAELTGLFADITKESFASTRLGSNLAFLIAQSKPLINVVNKIPVISYGATGLSTFSDLSLSLSGKQNWIESGMNLGVTTTAMAIGGWWGVLLQADYMAAKAYTKIICNHPEYIPSRQWGLR